PALDDFDGITILGNAALSSPAARARRRAGGRQPPDALGRRLRGRADLHARAGRQPRRALTPVRARRSPLPPRPTRVEARRLPLLALAARTGLRGVAPGALA